MGGIPCVRLINTALVLIRDSTIVQALQGQASTPGHEFPRVRLAKFLNWILKLSFPNPPILKHEITLQINWPGIRGSVLVYSGEYPEHPRSHWVAHGSSHKSQDEQRAEAGVGESLNTRRRHTVGSLKAEGPYGKPKGPEFCQSSELNEGPRAPSV